MTNAAFLNIRQGLIIVSVLILIVSSNNTSASNIIHTSIHKPLKENIRDLKPVQYPEILHQAFVNKDEKLFLANFPNTFERFKAKFGWNEQTDQSGPLYEKANLYLDYYFSLVSLPQYQNHQNNVIVIATAGKWQADAINYFLMKLHQLVETDKSVGQILNHLDDHKLHTFWRFYFSKAQIDYPPRLAAALDTGMRKKSLSVFEELQKERSQKQAGSQTGNYEVYDKDGFANLRQKADLSSKIIGRTNNGDHLQILNKTGDWWYVKAGDGSTGYLHKSRIRLSSKSGNVDSAGSSFTFNTISPNFNFKVAYSKYRVDSKAPAEMMITIHARKDQRKPVNVLFRPAYWSGKNFNAISYTGKVDTKEGVENYHKLIVADYNFDGLEDFAVLNYEGSNAGPQYIYFLQDNKGRFNKEITFPLQESFFSKKLDPETKTLTVSTLLGCCKLKVTVYQLIDKNQWEIISSKEEKIKA